MKPGTIIQSAGYPSGDYFDNTTICITEVNEKGITGLVLNRKYPRCLNELVEFIDSLPFPLNEGGPVEHEKLFFLHNRPDVITGSVLLNNNIYSGGDFKIAVSLLNMGLINAKEIKIFIGYSGWDAGQLEAEIDNEEWTILETHNIFI